MTLFVNTGDLIYQAPTSAETQPDFPVGTYNIVCDPDNIPGAFGLQPVKDFVLPKKVYGNNSHYSDKILKTFLSRSDSITSAALAGLKGSGKTLTSKEISIKAKELGVSTLILGSPYCGPVFNRWLQNITQPCIIFIDEFEKVYWKEQDRNSLLTLLDGAFKSHKLFLLTMNQVLDEKTFPFFFNRPGRVYFNITYGSITDDIITEYCQDNLTNTSLIPQVIKYSKRFTEFTLDILSILVNELNEVPQQTCEEISSIVNIKPDLSANHIEFNTVILNEKNEPQNVLTYGTASKNNSVVLPYNFLTLLLHNSNTTFNIPIFRAEELIEAAEKYAYGRSDVAYMDFNIDPDDYDLQSDEGKAEFEAELKNYRGKPLAHINHIISLTKDNVKHSQDPNTRIVTVLHEPTGYTFIIEAVGAIKKPLVYTF